MVEVDKEICYCGHEEEDHYEYDDLSCKISECPCEKYRSVKMFDFWKAK